MLIFSTMDESADNKKPNIQTNEKRKNQNILSSTRIAGSINVSINIDRDIENLSTIVKLTK